MSLRKAAEMALERLESHEYWMDEEAIQALRQALAQPEQEPVGYVTIETISSWAKVPSIKWFKKPTQGPLYTAPPKREWVGLTEWMPIETAPKNGTEVLVMYVHIDTQVVHNGFWLGANDTDDESDIGWWSYEHSEVSRIKLDDWMTPTHWLPLPTLKEKNT